jgi:hypothetical protein
MGIPKAHEAMNHVRVSSPCGQVWFIKGGRWKRLCSAATRVWILLLAPLIHPLLKGSPCLPLWGSTQVLARAEYTFVCLFKVTLAEYTLVCLFKVTLNILLYAFSKSHIGDASVLERLLLHVRICFCSSFVVVLVRAEFLTIYGMFLRISCV